MQKHKRGRRRSETPEQLLLDMAKLMLERGVLRWTAATEVAKSPEGLRFAEAHSMAQESFVQRLYRDFKPQTQQLLANARLTIENEQQDAKARVEMEEAEAKASLRRTVDNWLGMASLSRSASPRHPVDHWLDVSPLFRSASPRRPLDNWLDMGRLSRSASPRHPVDHWLGMSPLLRSASSRHNGLLAQYDTERESD